MDIIKFGMLTSWVAAFSKTWMTHENLVEFKQLVESCFPPAHPAPPTQVLRTFVEPDLVDDLLRALKQDKKIEAIKAYRVLTNVGLKESKDTIERYTQTFQDKQNERMAYRNEVLDDVINRLKQKDIDGWVIDIVSGLKVHT